MRGAVASSCPRAATSVVAPAARPSRVLLPVLNMFFRHASLFCLLAVLAAAQPLTPEAVARLALERHPRIAAARALIAEAEARASGVGRLPNPELETEFAAGSRERGRIEIGLTQTFPRTARLRLERRVAAESIALARREVAAVEAETIARARAAAVDLAAAREGLALAANQAELSREQAVALRRQADAGQSSSLDAAQADLAVRELVLALAEPRATLRAAELALAAELGMAPGELPELAVDLALPAEPASAPGGDFSARADLARADAALAVGDAEVALVRTAGREAWSGGVFVEGEQGRDDLGSREREAKLGLRFSVPLPVRDSSAPAVAEKQAARRRLALEREALAAAAQNEIALASATVSARHRQARALAEELLPAARAHLVAVEAARARGEVELSRVFSARERVSALERADLAARHAYHLAHLRLLAASGRLAL